MATSPLFSGIPFFPGSRWTGGGDWIELVDIKVQVRIGIV
jgi:hypothetical protein